MLTPHDDLPIHQTPAPVAVPQTGDLNHYDRYFFNGHAADASLFIGGAMGHYPNRGVVDAALAVVVDGVEHSLFASGRMTVDRATEVGPLRVEVLEGLRTVRLVAEPDGHGIAADLTFRARTVAIAEPRQNLMRGHVQVMDNTRLTQWGTWEGTIDLDGTTIAVDPTVVTGTRDRSWGTRAVGEQAPTNFEPSVPELFWLWAPLHFDDVCTHLALMEINQRRWIDSTLVLDVLGADDPTWGPDADPGREVELVDYDVTWVPGTREMASASLVVRDGDDTSTIELEKHFTFRMRGTGYGHHRFAHGSNHGELEVARESIVLDEFTPSGGDGMHIQTLVTARWGDRTGTGVLEQLSVGPHPRTGLTGVLDGYAG